MSTITSLPIWKRGATAAERFEELAQLAREQPERFRRVVVVYVEELPKPQGAENVPTLTRYVTVGCNTTEALGVFRLGEHELLRYTHNY